MRKLLYGTAVLLLSVTTVFADAINPANPRPTAIGVSSEATLQSMLNIIYGGPIVNAALDQQNSGVWQLPGLGDDVLTPSLRFEVATSAPTNIFGIWTGYDTAGPITKAPIFIGSDAPTTIANLQWFAGAPNTVKITNSAGVNSYVGINRSWFGFYLETAGGKTFYTADQLNTGGNPQALAYVGPGTRWTLAFEDVEYGSADKDFNDMVVSAESILPVPDGGVTLMLLGGALVGLETLRRKFRA